MPSAAMSFGDRLVLLRTDVSTDEVRSQISTGSCSTQPERGRTCSCSSWWRPTSAPSWSKMMQRVLVVPWSIEAMNSGDSATSSMMAYMGTRTFDIATMPRGGPNASCLDRRLETQRPEYLDRDDVDDRKRAVVRSLDRFGRLFGHHEMFARIALEEIADVADPKILELGSGHGGLSRALLEQHPTAQVTVTDVEPASVAAIAAGDLGSHPRATVREMDATTIDAPDGYYDLAVFVMSFHHLPPPLASRVFAEGTRAARKLLIIDLPRPPSPLHILQLA